MLHSLVLFKSAKRLMLMRLVAPRTEVSNSTPVRSRPQRRESNHCWRNLICNFGGKHLGYFAEEHHGRREEPAHNEGRAEGEPAHNEGRAEGEPARAAGRVPPQPAELEGGVAGRDPQRVEPHY